MPPTLNITIAPHALYWTLSSRPHQRIYLGQDVYVRGEDFNHLLRVKHIIRSTLRETIFAIANNSVTHYLEFWVCIPHHYLTLGTALQCISRRCAIAAGKCLVGCAPRRMTVPTLPNLGQLGNLQTYRHVLPRLLSSANVNGISSLFFSTLRREHQTALRPATYELQDRRQRSGSSSTITHHIPNPLPRMRSFPRKPEPVYLPDQSFLVMD